MLKTQNLISEVLIPHEGGLKWRICETGAGCPVASAILSTSGASAIIYDTHVPYGNDSQEDAGYTDGSFRSVSMEFCANVIARKSANVNANAVYVSSFQVGEDKCTHGWIGISHRDFAHHGTAVTKYYHITLGVGIPRSAAIRRIGDIGIVLIARALGQAVAEPIEIDNVIDHNGNTVWDELLESSNDFAVVLENYGIVNDKGDMVPSMRANRLEKLRGRKDLIIMPGSFNPIHDGHKEMMRKTGEWIRHNVNSTCEEQFDGLYCITMNNFDPAKDPTAQSVIDRAAKIVLTNDVLVTNSPRLKDFTKLKSRLGDVQLHVPVGWDTFMRMEDDLFTEKFSFITWHIFDRDNAISGYRKDGAESAKQVIRNLEAHEHVVLHEEREHMSMSSTEIRNNGGTGE